MLRPDPFESWNLRLLQAFFPAGLDGKEVFLDTTPARLDALGSDLGGDEGFVSAVLGGPPWTMPGSFVDRITALKEQRTNSRKRPPGYADPSKYDASFLPGGEVKNSAPAYLPYLAVMARVASVANSDGYYERLREELCLPHGWASSQMKRVVDVWDDLQDWTKAKGGHHGKFVARPLGIHRLIGLPKSQVIIAARDIPIIHKIFEVQRIAVHDPLSTEEVEALTEAIARGPYPLSSALRQAAREAGYGGLLAELLKSIHGDWTGIVDTASPQGENPTNDEAGAILGIALSEGNVAPWHIQVAVDASEEEVMQAVPDCTDWAMRYRAGGRVVGRVAPTGVEEFFAGAVWKSQLGGRDFTIKHRLLWVLVGEMSPSGVWEAWEGELPSHGGAYLLARSNGVEMLTEYLQKAHPDYRDVPIAGLPADWRMVYLEPGQELTDTQRNLLDGYGQRQRPGLLRFEGGQRIREQGKQAYLHYDLPRVVLSAPESVKLECEGLELIAMDGHGGMATVAGVPMASAERRFDFREADKGGRVRLKAVGEHGRVLDEKEFLVVVALEFEGKSIRADRCLDEMGRVQFGDDGLRGGLTSPIVKANGGIPSEPGFKLATSDALGVAMDSKLFEKNPAARFLDRLSRDAFMSYGRAKELLERLVARHGALATAWSILEDLASRGNLELERSSGGYIAYIHAVPPSAYELPVLKEGDRLFGILGTPLLGQWSELGAASEAWRAFAHAAVGSTREGKAYLPVVRLRSTSADEVMGESLATMGFRILPMQGVAIANWSADETVVRSEVHGRARGDHGSAEHLQKFDANEARFLPCEGPLERPVASDKTLKLYRYDDPHVRGRKLHLLASSRGFTGVIDLQWAKWLVLGDRGNGLRQWPAVYNEEKREFWLPASLRLPPLLDRALVLCSGAPPDKYQMRRGPEEGAGWVWIQTLNARQDVVRVSSGFYTGMAEGDWLRYSWVPLALVQAIHKTGK